MQGHRILLVEDNPADADLTCEALQDSGHAPEIAIAEDGEQAVDFLYKRGEHSDALTPNLVLLDLNLPRRNGAEVLADIRAHPELKLLPVVIWSSSESDDDIHQAYQLGANCYLSKPMDHIEFQSVLRSMHAFWLKTAKLPRTN